ncbi:MAG: ABC transporter permease [Clostridia bacterium]|nr:ABC transporter permease [Clostridia bacterium]
MVALGEGSQLAIEERMTAMGTNLLQITPRRQSNRTGQQMVMRVSAFTKKDIQKLKDESSFAVAISGIIQSNANVVGGEGNAQVTVQGVEPDYTVARNWNVNAGVFFDEDDLAFRNSVAVLGRTTAKTLFGDADRALSGQIRIGTTYFTVIGLLEIKGAGMNGNDQDDIVMVPLDTAMTRLSNSRNINQIVMSIVSKEYMEAAQKETELILRESRNIPDGITPDFAIMNQADMIEMASATSKTLTTLLAAIAGVSLLVGGIGIMNIMLVSVTERTREIGVRKAIGAERRSIIAQFLVETSMVSGLGGLVGVIVGVIVTMAYVKIEHDKVFYPHVNIMALAFCISVALGILFGLYPAVKASRLQPVDALRNE